MSKRYHDTEIWGEDWFIALSKDYRAFWFYIKDKCDHIGIWRPNVSTFNKLYDAQVETKKALELFNQDKERIKVLTNGRWFIIEFIPFQYGLRLNPKNRVHFSVLEALEKNEVNLTSIRGLIGVTDSLKDKDKDKDIYKDLLHVKTKEKHLPETFKYWDNKYNSLTGEKYLFNGSKEGALLKRILKTYGKDKTFDLVDYFFKEAEENPNCWWQDKVTIGVFSTCVPKMLRQITSGIRDGDRK